VIVPSAWNVWAVLASDSWVLSSEISCIPGAPTWQPASRSSKP